MNEPDPMLVAGATVRLTFAGRTVAAVVVLASSNGRSLMLTFEAVLGGYVGAMPLLWEAGTWRELFGDRREAQIALLE